MMVHTVVDGTFRQTNLTNEPSEYLTKRGAAPFRNRAHASARARR